MRSVLLKRDLMVVRVEKKIIEAYKPSFFYVADLLIKQDESRKKITENKQSEEKRWLNEKYNLTGYFRDDSPSDKSKKSVMKQAEALTISEELDDGKTNEEKKENHLFAVDFSESTEETFDDNYEDIDQVTSTSKGASAVDDKTNMKCLYKNSPLVVMTDDKVCREARVTIDSLNNKPINFLINNSPKPYSSDIIEKPNEFRRFNFAAREKYLTTSKESFHNNSKSSANGNFIIALDKDGDLICLPDECVEEYEQIGTKCWYYPCKTTPFHITLFLTSVKQAGTFVVYSCLEEAEEELCLSVVSPKLKVLHYPIIKSSTGSFQLAKDSVSFLSVSEMVESYQNSRGTLVTRLRRPLKNVHRHVTTFEEYNSEDEIPKDCVTIRNQCYCNNPAYRKFSGVCEKESGPPIKVDVKVLADEACQTRVEDFFYEACLLKCLRHHNIIAFIGVTFRSKPHYLIMENSHYGNLRTCIAREILPDLQPTNLKNIFVQILRALCYLETCKCVHRNISASAFYVTDKGVIKLGDFDKARKMKNANDCYIAEEDENLNLRNAAPEVLTNLRYSIKSDVWACGILMWELYSKGALPYDGLTSAEMIYEIVFGKRLLERPSQCEERVYELMTQCWSMLDYKRPSYCKLLKCLKARQALEVVNSAFKKTPSKTGSWKVEGLRSSLQNTWKNTLDRRFTVGGVPSFLTPATIRKSIQSMDSKKFRQIAVRSKEVLLKGSSRSLHLRRSNDTGLKETASKASFGNEVDDISLATPSTYMNVASSEVYSCSFPENSFIQEKAFEEDLKKQSKARRPQSVESFAKKSPSLDFKLWDISRKKMLKRKGKSDNHPADL